MREVLRRIMGGEHGYSLIELLVTMVILSIVLASLTTVFLSGTTAEASLNRRFQAQQSARAGLDKIRGDIHCATAAQAQTINTFPGLKLAVANCYAATPTISWCAVQVTAAPPRYKLYRSTTTGATTCGASDAARLLIADYLSTSSAFTTATIPQYTLQRVGVDFKVSADGKAATADTYELTDSIAVRNATRCLTAGGCTAPVVP
jgi:prepilin-type N-terminal cleavage/methylation domain-containing protein